MFWVGKIWRDLLRVAGIWGFEGVFEWKICRDLPVIFKKMTSCNLVMRGESRKFSEIFRDFPANF